MPQRFFSVISLPIFWIGVMFFVGTLSLQSETAQQFILVNCKLNPGWNKEGGQAVSRDDFIEVKRALPDIPDSNTRVGVAFIFSYFRTDRDARLIAAVEQVLALARETDTPVLIQLDGENWWDARPDLWNWWDPSLPGFNPLNRENVEWSSWSSHDALKIAWRNWGRQLRVRPPPNLMSQRYREACHEKMELLIPVVMKWWNALPKDKKELLVGIKLGWESSIGVNAWYYPNGNDLLNKSANDDPTSGLNGEDIPARGVTTIGYAAVKTAGLRQKGKLTEGDLAEVVRRHLEDLSKKAASLGVPREKLFTHVAGWKDEELLYSSGLNRFSCPGWSFYKHASDPRKDIGVQTALQKTDAPWWAATEWLYQGERDATSWKRALQNTLSDKRCRYLCIFNWDGIRENSAALEAIQNVVKASRN